MKAKTAAPVKKKRLYKFYLVRVGNSDIIELRRTVNALKAIHSTLHVPRLPTSPKHLDDGSVNYGLHLEQTWYTGGKTIAVCKANSLYYLNGVDLNVKGIKKITREQKERVLKLAFQKYE